MEISLHACSATPLGNRTSRWWRRRRRRKDDNQTNLLGRPRRRPRQPSPDTIFSKPTPTPLQTQLSPTTLTREQALDDVLRDLASSVKAGVAVEPAVFSSLLETCFQTGRFEHGIRLHSLIPPNVLRNSGDLSSKLLRLYAATGVVEEAHRLFDEMPSRNRQSAFPWNSVISGYVELGLYEDAMALYFQMEEDGVEADRFTFPRVLKACAGIGSIAVGQSVHRQAVRSGFGTDRFVLNALVDMYAKCGDIAKSRRIFDMIEQRDTVSWSSILAGYARHGLWDEALSVFRQMLHSGFHTDSTTISTVLSGKWALRIGLEIHAWALRRGVDESTSVANALVAMYSNHGRLVHAWRAFELTPAKDVVSWNTIIHAHRRDPKVVMIFRQMEEGSDVPPDKITFVSLLSACAHLGMVEAGRGFFTRMVEKYKIKPGMEHYGCMVNLLGRAGFVGEAYELVISDETTASDAGPSIWGALLFACTLHGNVGVAEIAARKLFDLEPDNAHNFVLLIKVYEREGMRMEVEKVRQMMRERGLNHSNAFT